MTHLAFDSPWYLVLLLGLPVLWWLSLRSLSAMGRVRRVLAITLRSSVIYLCLVWPWPKPSGSAPAIA